MPDRPQGAAAFEGLDESAWEALCDGCGKCCLHKLEDEDSGEVYLTAVACRFLDQESIRCQCYPERQKRQPACLVIRPDAFPEIARILPHTCAYRLTWEGKPLPDWHPVRQKGSQVQMRLCGHSVRDRVISEDRLEGEPDEDEWQALIIGEWSPL